jgi:hypothetical protein
VYRVSEWISLLWKFNADTVLKRIPHLHAYGFASWCRNRCLLSHDGNRVEYEHKGQQFIAFIGFIAFANQANQQREGRWITTRTYMIDLAGRNTKIRTHSRPNPLDTGNSKGACREMAYVRYPGSYI